MLVMTIMLLRWRDELFGESNEQEKMLLSCCYHVSPTHTLSLFMLVALAAE